jgi:hypothetical protein
MTITFKNLNTMGLEKRKARFLRPSPLKEVNPAGTPRYRNGTESFFGWKGHPSVVRDI